MSPPGPDDYATIPVLYSLYELPGDTVEYDEEEVDEFTFALMYLVSFELEKDLGHRAWKGFDWDTLNRLHEKGFIGDPVGKAKSVYVTPEGYKRMEELFQKHFAVNG
jgi:hypothetical protein